MSRSLSLLTKIENEEFTDFQEIDLTEKVNEAIFDFQELLELKEIKMESELEKDVLITSDPVLIQILITNMFQNAIRHNVAKGTIFVKLTTLYLRVINTGKPLQTSTSELFERFKKDNQSGETIGLGLAIMKKICDINDFEVDYKAEKETHTLEVRFRRN